MAVRTRSLWVASPGVLGQPPASLGRFWGRRPFVRSTIARWHEPTETVVDAHDFQAVEVSVVSNEGHVHHLNVVQNDDVEVTSRSRGQTSVRMTAKN